MRVYFMEKDSYTDVNFSDVAFTTKLMRTLHHYKKNGSLDSKERETLERGYKIFNDIVQYSLFCESHKGHSSVNLNGFRLYSAALKAALKIVPRETKASSFFDNLYTTLDLVKKGKKDEVISILEPLMKFLFNFHNTLSEEVSSKGLEELALTG